MIRAPLPPPRPSSAPTPPLPVFEGDSQNSASAPSELRGFKLKIFWPAIGGGPRDHRRTLGLQRHQRQQHAAACRSMSHHAAACRSARFWELLVGVLKHAAACRSEPKFSHGGLFFFITCQTCEPFVAQMSQNWMVAQWSMCQVPVWRVLGSVPGKGNFLPVSSSLLLHRPSLFWCCFDMSSPEDTLVFETCAAFGK